ncbi:MAG: hypothetical protein JXA78_04595 [Anaerolineales bacterium]|nr:hypothetical protein [Anaerolineales bacterium]
MRRRGGGEQASEASQRAGTRLVIVFLAMAIFMAANFFLYLQSGMPFDPDKLPLLDLGLRYVCLPPVLLAILLVAGARYVQGGHDVKSFGSALNYLLANLALGLYPSLMVSDGKAQIKPDEDNLVALIGGPGHVVVQPGNAVLIESLDGEVHAHGSGRHFLNRREALKETISLEEREASIEKLSAATKDGIEMEVRDIRYRYRLASDQLPEDGPGRDMQDPYPFSEQAVVDMTYNRNVTAFGAATWHFGVNNIVDTVITDYIRQHQVDYLMAPSAQGNDPRAEIYECFNSEDVRRQFKKRGAELQWIGIGHFDVANKKVVEQRVNAWQAKWIGDAKVVRAFGESQRMAYQEMGRAEAEAEMLMSIVHALEEVGAQEGDSKQRIRAIYLARIAQLLEAMGKQQYLPPGAGSSLKL